MEGARYFEDGSLVIFRRSSGYYARIRTQVLPVKYVWRSLKTSNEQTAIDLGRRLLFQLEQRAERGLPTKSKLFSTVIDDYIAHRRRDHEHGKTLAGMLKQVIRVSKFWREYAGLLAVETIDDKVMREFIAWRRDYYSTFKTLPKNGNWLMTMVGSLSARGENGDVPIEQKYRLIVEQSDEFYEPDCLS